MNRVYGRSSSLNGLPAPGADLLNAVGNRIRAGANLSVIEHHGPLTLSSDSFATGGGVRKDYGPYSYISLTEGQSIQPKSGVTTRTASRYAKIIGLTLAVGICFAGFAALAAVLWYSNRLLSPWGCDGLGYGGYGLGGYGLGGYGCGGYGPWGCW